MITYGQWDRQNAHNLIPRILLLGIYLVDVFMQVKSMLSDFMADGGWGKRFSLQF